MENTPFDLHKRLGGLINIRKKALVLPSANHNMN